MILFWLPLPLTSKVPDKLGFMMRIGIGALENTNPQVACPITSVVVDPESNPANETGTLLATVART